MTTDITQALPEPSPGEATAPELRDALALCTPNQRRYLSVLVRTGERDVAAKAAGVERSTARNWRYHSPSFKALERLAESQGWSIGQELVRQRFGRGADQAGAVVEDVLHDDEIPARERLRAATIILDREYPIQRGTVIVPIHINYGFSRNDADADTVDGVVIEHGEPQEHDDGGMTNGTARY